MNHKQVDIKKLWEIIEGHFVSDNNDVKGIANTEFKENMDIFKRRYIQKLKDRMTKGNICETIGKALTKLSEAKKIDHYHSYCGADVWGSVLCIHYRAKWYYNRYSVAIPGLKIVKHRQ